MKVMGIVAIGILSLVSFGCVSAPASDAPPLARAGGEWLGSATVGPKIGCCVGSSGPVRLLLEQSGEAVQGSIEGVGFRGPISATVTADGLWGSCLCQTSSLAQRVSIEGAISGDEMVFRLGDSRMTLSRRL
jgi:hypothetical protein